jgi:serine/threonine protein kinase
MDYIQGANLEVLWRQRPEMRFSLSETLVMLAPIFDAVAYLHRQCPPILHRDIKPANIIWTSTGEKTVLVDFGISKEYDPDATTTAIRHCSRGYAAPEQYAIGTNTRSDIYGLGATLYTLLTGLVPVDAFIRVTQLENNKFDPLKPLNSLTPDVPIHISEVIQRAMAIGNSDRFSTVEEFWQALHDAPTEEISTLQVMSGRQPIIVSQRGEGLRPASISKQLGVSRLKRGSGLVLLFLALLISVGLGVSFFAYFVSSPVASSAPHISLPAHAAPAAFPTSRPAVGSTVTPLITPTHPTPTRIPTRPKPPHHPHHPHH